MQLPVPLLLGAQNLVMVLLSPLRQALHHACLLSGSGVPPLARQTPADHDHTLPLSAFLAKPSPCSNFQGCPYATTQPVMADAEAAADFATISLRTRRYATPSWLMFVLLWATNLVMVPLATLMRACNVFSGASHFMKYPSCKPEGPLASLQVLLCSSSCEAEDANADGAATIIAASLSSHAAPLMQLAQAGLAAANVALQPAEPLRRAPTQPSCQPIKPSPADDHILPARATARPSLKATCNLPAGADSRPSSNRDADADADGDGDATIISAFLGSLVAEYHAADNPVAIFAANIVAVAPAEGALAAATIAVTPAEDGLAAHDAAATLETVGADPGTLARRPVTTPTGALAANLDPPKLQPTSIVSPAASDYAHTAHLDNLLQIALALHHARAWPLAGLHQSARDVSSSEDYPVVPCTTPAGLRAWATHPAAPVVNPVQARRPVAETPNFGAHLPSSSIKATAIKTAADGGATQLADGLTFTAGLLALTQPLHGSNTTLLGHTLHAVSQPAHAPGKPWPTRRPTPNGGSTTSLHTHLHGVSATSLLGYPGMIPLPALGAPSHAAVTSPAAMYQQPIMTEESLIIELFLAAINAEDSTPATQPVAAGFPYAADITLSASSTTAADADRAPTPVPSIGEHSRPTAPLQDNLVALPLISPATEDEIISTFLGLLLPADDTHPAEEYHQHYSSPSGVLTPARHAFAASPSMHGIPHAATINNPAHAAFAAQGISLTPLGHHYLPRPNRPICSPLVLALSIWMS
ncbi:hypothetical protein L7F22_064622 [Adiantum nelumboides]|nr:hypothetical protein [Adiantum nelumboides]